MRAVHFGAGNIGRGFIAEVLAKNAFEISFVDIDETLIGALKEADSYEVALADDSGQTITVENFTGLHSVNEEDAIVEAIAEADLVTTAIGPNVLAIIAPTIAKGLEKRAQNEVETKLDVIACENMIKASTFLGDHVKDSLSEAGLTYVNSYVGFPDSAVDRIIPEQKNEDPLYVSVEPFSEWVVEEPALKNDNIHLDGVLYVDNLEPYIERKLFSVNTGHATVAYAGAYHSFETVKEAIDNEQIHQQLVDTLNETGAVLEEKWGFDHDSHQDYIQTIVQRFENPSLSDDVNRVARGPIRKLGGQERFIQPMKEAKNLGLSYDNLLKSAGMAFVFDNPQDEESSVLQDKLSNGDTAHVVKEVTGLDDVSLIEEIVEKIKELR